MREQFLSVRLSSSEATYLNLQVCFPRRDRSTVQPVSVPNASVARRENCSVLLAAFVIADRKHGVRVRLRAGMYEWHIAGFLLESPASP